jgi:hypothetical protein
MPTGEGILFPRSVSGERNFERRQLHTKAVVVNFAVMQNVRKLSNSIILNKIKRTSVSLQKDIQEVGSG